MADLTAANLLVGTSFPKQQLRRARFDWCLMAGIELGYVTP